MNIPKTKIETNKFGNPLNAPITQGDPPNRPIVPWQYGVKQGILTYKIRASVGQFKNITFTAGSNIMGTFVDSAFNNGTINNPLILGGIDDNPTITTGTINTSAFRNGTLGTCLLEGGTYGTGIMIGGTANPSAYEINGTVGQSGSIVYVKSVNFAGSTTTLGTVQFQSGLITAFS